MRLTDLANPSRFLALTDRILPWLAVATLDAFAFGISQAYFAPDDYQGVMETMKGFMIDKTRGLEQLYTIIQKRPKQ